jgi:hypothetical protein
MSPAKALVLLWAVAVVTPLTFASTKTPTAALIALPPLWLMVACLIDRALAADWLPWVAWLATTVMSFVVSSARASNYELGYPIYGVGYPPTGRASLLLESTWAFEQIAGVCAIVALVMIVPRVAAWVAAFPKKAQVAAAAIGLALLAFRGVEGAWAVGRWQGDRPTYAEIADFARSRLPQNAALVFDAGVPEGAHQLVMFRADRTCYARELKDARTTALTIRQQQGIPFLVSDRALALPVVFHSARDGLTVYAISNAGALQTGQ